MEIESDSPNFEKQEQVESHIISPGFFKMVAFSPNVMNLELQLLNQSLPLPPPPPLSDSRHKMKGKKFHHIGPFGSSLYSKLYSLNERKLRLAASTCNVEVLWDILKQGVNPNCYDEHRRSPLHLAACRGYGDIVAILCQYNANPNIVDSLGNTPLHLSVISASSKKFNNVVRLLLQHGASVHAKDRTGSNALELATKKLNAMKYRNESPTPEMKEIIQDLCVLVALISKHFMKEKKDLDNLELIEEQLSKLSTNDTPMDVADALLASVDNLKL